MGNPINPGNAAQYLKLVCFAAPAPANRLGDAARDVARGQGLIDWDAWQLQFALKILW
jgi:hypothetical protein